MNDVIGLQNNGHKTPILLRWSIKDIEGSSIVVYRYR